MEPRVITALPLTELAALEGSATRVGSVAKEEIQSLLRSGLVQFVVADIGKPLEWIPAKECFAFWKEEVRGHLASGDCVRLEEFPGEYCYFASKWVCGSGLIVLLEKHH